MKSFLVMHACGHGRTAYVTASMISPGWEPTLERVQGAMLREARLDCPECRRRQLASYRFGLAHFTPNDPELAQTRAAERWRRQRGDDNAGGAPPKTVDRWLRQLDYECRPPWRRVPKVPWYRATLHVVEYLIANDWAPAELGEQGRWGLLLDSPLAPGISPEEGRRPVLSLNPDPALFELDRFRVVEWYPRDISRADLWCHLFFALYRAAWLPGGHSPHQMAWRHVREKVAVERPPDTTATE